MSPPSTKPGEGIQADSLVFTVLSAHHVLSHFCVLPPITPLPPQCHHHRPGLPNKILFILQNQFISRTYASEETY